MVVIWYLIVITDYLGIIAYIFSKLIKKIETEKLKKHESWGKKLDFHVNFGIIFC